MLPICAACFSKCFFIKGLFSSVFLNQKNVSKQNEMNLSRAYLPVCGVHLQLQEHFQYISAEWLCSSSSPHTSVVFPVLCFAVQRWNSEAGREGEKLPFIWDAVCGVSEAALNLRPMRRKHVHETICNGKTNPITMAWILYSKMHRQQMYCKMYKP